MDLIKALTWRYAVRRFSEQQLSDERLEALLQATRLSASSYGLQPYRILLLKSPALRRRLLPYSMGQDKVLHCSHLIVLAARRDVGDNIVDEYISRLAEVRAVAPDGLQKMAAHIKAALAAMNETQRLQWAHQQAYIALGNLLTSASLLQIDTCPMAGFDTAGYDQVLGLADKGLTTSVLCAIGIRHPDDESATLAKVRLSHDDLVLSY